MVLDRYSFTNRSPFFKLIVENNIPPITNKANIDSIPYLVFSVTSDIYTIKNGPITAANLPNMLKNP